MSLEQNLQLQKSRMTVNINNIYVELINNLIGSLGESKSSVVYYIIKDWVSKNTEKIKNDWGVDLTEIRENYIANNFGLKFDDILNKLEKDIIKKLSHIKKGFKSIPVKDLAETMDVNPKIIRKVILNHQVELEVEGIHFFINEDKVINSDFEKS